MRCVGRHRLQRLRHDFGDLLVIDLARRAAARLVIKAIEALFGKPRPPWSDSQPGDAECGRDRAIVHAIGGQQRDLGSHDTGRGLPAAPGTHSSAARSQADVRQERDIGC